MPPSSHADMIESHEERIQRLEATIPNAQAAQGVQLETVMCKVDSLSEVIQKTDEKIEDLRETIAAKLDAQSEKLSSIMALRVVEEEKKKFINRLWVFAKPIIVIIGTLALGAVSPKVAALFFEVLK